ncbi:unnamed protein product [Paramecium sonneborni]|uniref:Uncharacterized protein n=1 Tax=Paramecium sonneborni TaxID=65129 RepID=A0A8S1PYJ4_9CILI|nr:unnamed protein product [Paramecium sonneborni]CAD8108096.1 unnamed protein product [Paramecium sonneborni]
MQIRQPTRYPIVPQIQNLNQYGPFVSPTQRTSQNQRVGTPNTLRFDYQRLRNTQSMQQYPIVKQAPVVTPQKAAIKKPHIKMHQPGQTVSQLQTPSYDPSLMVGLIKENQEIKAKIAQKEKELQLLNEEIALYEQKS